jgi:hypothetical protein
VQRAAVHEWPNDQTFSVLIGSSGVSPPADQGSAASRQKSGRPA